MASDPKAAALALHRFGCGPRAGSIAIVARDPRAALLAELQRPQAGLIKDKSLIPTAAMARALNKLQTAQTSQAPQAPQVPPKKAAPGGKAMAMAMAAESKTSGPAIAKGDVPPAKAGPAPTLPRELFLKELKAHVGMATSADIGFVERLAWFWTNHFSVSTEKVGPIAGSFQREAIRPYVLGRFADMLLAVESHLAMLFYLDNSSSTGPNSEIGLGNDQGLNENLAREIMELHTLGVRSGYTQEDVTRLAKVITGWTIVSLNDPRRGGEFTFAANMHEPGPQTILGKTYPDSGVAQGRAVLADLARHPATARFLSTKLARYFVADEPPPALVDRLTANFLATDGDLKELAKTLIQSPEAWNEARTKIKQPIEVVIGAVRTTGVEPVPEGVSRALTVLGQPIWRPGGPNGFPDENAAWVDGLPQRLEIASEYAGRVADRLNPIALIDVALGPLASEQTRQTVKLAGSRQQALTMLLMAPEFHRR
jgi:uncharacterized protein (DUF1800 family)